MKARGLLLQRYALALFILACVLGAAGRAATRALWYDELLTVYVSNLSDAGAVWSALAAGVDLNPPFLHFATRAALTTGDGPLAVRLPSLIAFGLALLGIFIVAARHQRMRVGWLAAALLLWTQAGPYAYEARPYAILLACTVFAYACWQRIPENRWWAAGLAASLMVATSSHYYSVLLFPALAAGEAVRTWERRRMDAVAWIAFAGGALPLLFWLPLIRAAQEFSTNYWGRPSIGAMVQSFGWMLSSATTPVLLLVGIVAIAFALRSAFAAPRVPADPENAPIPLSDWTVALMIAAIPVFAYLVALVTGAFTNRYALPAVIGWCVIFARIPNQLVRTSTGRAAILAATIAVVAATLAKYAPPARDIMAGAPRVEGLAMLERAPREPHRILITEGVPYLQLARYASPRLRERLMFPGIPERGIAIARTNTSTEGLRRLNRFVPIQTVPFDSAIARREAVLVYGRVNWVVKLLRESGATLSLLGEDDDRLLLLARWDLRPRLLRSLNAPRRPLRPPSPVTATAGVTEPGRAEQPRPLLPAGAKKLPGIGQRPEAGRPMIFRTFHCLI